MPSIAGYSYSAWFRSMLKLSMTPFGRNEEPPIILDEPNRFTNFHD